MNWYAEVLKKYAVFEGRAHRTEYWTFTLINVLIYFSTAFLSASTQTDGLMIVAYLYMIAMIVPSLAVSIRRLHDTGRSGWWVLLSLVPLVGLVFIVFMVLDSEPGDNAYGPNQKPKPASG